MSKALAPDKPTQENSAKVYAQWLAQGYPVIYGWDYLSPVALRWQTQLNENSKVIAHAGALPEMNHNEVVAWAHASELIKKMRVILLRSPEEEPSSIKARFELTKQIIAPQAEVREALPEGKGKLARQLSLVYLSDIVSIYLAFLGEKDPIEINAINFLKKELAKASA
jgi:glucose/mannose-6-phosphate isomerase